MKEQLKKEIDQLRSEFNNVQKRLSKKVDKMKDVLNKEDKDYIGEIPTNINKITDVQWEWILHHYHDETTTHYKYSVNFLQNLGFSTHGFSKEQQFILGINQYYGIDYDKIAKNLPLVLKHIKIKSVVVQLEIDDDVYLDFNDDEYTLIKNGVQVLKTKSLEKILKIVEENT